jgi:GNAT superfamily N-acetyltransferase
MPLNQFMVLRAGLLHIAEVDLSQHAGVCIRFLRDSFLHSFGSDEFWCRTFGADGAKYAEWLASYRGLMFHAWREDEIVGELMLDPDAGYLQHLYVVSEFRGKGMAIVLHDHFLRLVRSAGRFDATLKVSRTNLRAIRFYERRGWQRLRADAADPKLDVYNIVLPKKSCIGREGPDTLVPQTDGGASMNEKPSKNVSGFSLKLDEAEAERFLKLLSDEGLMRAGFVIHESNNISVTVELNPKPPSKAE